MLFQYEFLRSTVLVSWTCAMVSLATWLVVDGHYNCCTTVQLWYVLSIEHLHWHHFFNANRNIAASVRRLRLGVPLTDFSRIAVIFARQTGHACFLSRCIHACRQSRQKTCPHFVLLTGSLKTVVQTGQRWLVWGSCSDCSQTYFSDVIL